MGAASSGQVYRRGCFQDGHRLVGEEGGGEVRSPRVLMKRPPRSAGTSPALRVCVQGGYSGRKRKGQGRVEVTTSVQK